MQAFTPFSATLAATATCGTLDIVFAFWRGAQAGVAPHRVLQYISSGLLGRGAYGGGTATAALGLLLHYAIMLVICALYIAASRRLPPLTQQWLACGVAYGLMIYVGMSHAVVPLSRIGPQPYNWPGLLWQVAAMILLVGVPTAWFARRVTG